MGCGELTQNRMSVMMMFPNRSEFQLCGSDKRTNLSTTVACFNLSTWDERGGPFGNKASVRPICVPKKQAVTSRNDVCQ